MENTTELNDQSVLAIARAAIERNFSPIELQGVSLELKKRAPSRWSDFEDRDEPAVVSVWIIHMDNDQPVNSEATAAANREMWSELQLKGDGRTLLLYHGYPNDPATRKSAA